MDQATVDELIRGKFGARKSNDGRDWYIPSSSDDKVWSQFDVFRGSGSFAEVLSFERYPDRKDLCVKVSHIRNDEPESYKKTKSMEMYRNELGALVRTTEASIQGVVRLVASTTWNHRPALILHYHGTLTLAKALHDKKITLKKTKDDIIGQLVQTALDLNVAKMAHNDIAPTNIMLQKKLVRGIWCYHVTLVDLGTATILSEDGMSAPPLTGSPGYMDPRVSYARMSCLNGVSTNRTINGLQSDLFSIAMVAVNMHDNLVYYPIDIGVEPTSLEGLDHVLYELVRKAGSNIWADRWDLDGARESAFMVRWREFSRFAPGKFVPAEVPSPCLSKVQQPQQRKLDVVQAMSDGGGGSSSAIGQANVDADASGVVKPAAGPMAVDDPCPPAGAAGAAASAGQEMSANHSSPKNRDGVCDTGASANISGSSAAGGALGAVAAVDRPSSSESAVLQQHYRGQGDSAGGGGGSSAGGRGEVGGNKSGAVLKARAVKGATARSAAAAAASAAAYEAATAGMRRMIESVQKRAGQGSSKNRDGWMSSARVAGTPLSFLGAAGISALRTRIASLESGAQQQESVGQGVSAGDGESGGPPGDGIVMESRSEVVQGEAAAGSAEEAQGAAAASARGHAAWAAAGAAASAGQEMSANHSSPKLRDGVCDTGAPTNISGSSAAGGALGAVAAVDRPSSSESAVLQQHYRGQGDSAGGGGGCSAGGRGEVGGNKSGAVLTAGAVKGATARSAAAAAASAAAYEAATTDMQRTIESVQKRAGQGSPKHRDGWMSSARVAGTPLSFLGATGISALGTRMASSESGAQQQESVGQGVSAGDGESGGPPGDGIVMESRSEVVQGEAAAGSAEAAQGAAAASARGHAAWAAAGAAASAGQEMSANHSSPKLRDGDSDSGAMANISGSAPTGGVLDDGVLGAVAAVDRPSSSESAVLQQHYRGQGDSAGGGGGSSAGGRGEVGGNKSGAVLTAGAVKGATARSAAAAAASAAAYEAATADMRRTIESVQKRAGQGSPKHRDGWMSSARVAGTSLSFLGAAGISALGTRMASLESGAQQQESVGQGAGDGESGGLPGECNVMESRSGVVQGEAAAGSVEAAQGAAAASAQDNTLTVAGEVGGIAKNEGTKKRRRDDPENDEGQSSSRSKRRDGGGSSGGGGDIKGVGDESALVTPPIRAKMKMRSTTLQKTAESARVQKSREKAKKEASKGPATRSKAVKTRKRTAETARAGGGAAPKRSRRL